MGKVFFKTLLATALLFSFHSFAFAEEGRTVELTVRGVSFSHFTLLPAAGPNAYQPIGETHQMQAGDKVRIPVGQQHLPGEFILFFEYAVHPGQQPERSETNIFINEQDLYININPAFAQNPDSIQFQDGERENTTLRNFFHENSERRSSLEPLQWFIARYNDTEGELYQLAVETWETRRKTYNRWVAGQSEKHAELFAGMAFQFQQIPPIGTSGSPDERLLYMLENYFDAIDFNNEKILKISAFPDWLNGYMNIYSDLVASAPDQMQDLYIMAGRNILEASMGGHPKVCGYLVDYFYGGYESHGIEGGLSMLGSYLQMPDCQSERGAEMLRQIEAREKLAIGNAAPDFQLESPEGKPFQLYDQADEKPYKLLLFWSAECGPCEYLLSKMESWYSDDKIKNAVEVIAINLDKEYIEYEKWRYYKEKLNDWLHFRLPGGFFHPLATEYNIYATPQMFLLSSENHEIITSTFDLAVINQYVDK